MIWLRSIERDYKDLKSQTHKEKLAQSGSLQIPTGGRFIFCRYIFFKAMMSILYKTVHFILDLFPKNSNDLFCRV